jgi:hypothetical protein
MSTPRNRSAKNAPRFRGDPASSVPEIRKLAHTLGVEPDRLHALAAVPAADLHALRKQISHALFEADKAHFAKVAALSKAVPVALAAKLAEYALPPLLAARTAELIEPSRAVDLVARLSDRYLADVSAAMDAPRAADVIAHIPADRVAKVAAELARRQEWVVIGGFVAVVSKPALSASVRVFDGEQLLRIGFVLEDKDRLDEVSGLLTEQQLDATLDAAHKHGLWAELDDLLAHVSPARADRLAARFATASPELKAATAAAVRPGGLTAEGLSLLERGQ